jgi:hypothetical protein
MCRGRGRIPRFCHAAFSIVYAYASRLLERSPSIAEVDALHCRRRLDRNRLGAVHNRRGIPGFLAQLMVGIMFRICCFSVRGGVYLLLCCKRNKRTAVNRPEWRNGEACLVHSPQAPGLSCQLKGARPCRVQTPDFGRLKTSFALWPLCRSSFVHPPDLSFPYSMRRSLLISRD